MHLFATGLYAAQCLIIRQLICGVTPLSFNFQNSLDNSLLFSYFRTLNDVLWLPYLDLKAGSLTPAYIFSP